MTGKDMQAGDRAHVNYERIIQAKAQCGRDFLVLGRLLKECRDEKHFVALGHDTFEEFLGSPEVAMSRAMVFNLIKAVEVYLDRLSRPVEELAEVGISKLTAIVPVVEADPDGWLARARELSRSDLALEVSEATGKPQKSNRLDTPRTTDLRPPRPDEAYVDYVRDSPCCVCGKHATEGGKTNAAHFPLSRGAGAPDSWVIPLCGDCHAEHHQDQVRFMTAYQRQWAAWFYRMIEFLGNAAGPKKIWPPEEETK